MKTSKPQQKNQRKTREACGENGGAAHGSVPDLHRARVLRLRVLKRAQVLERSIVKLHGKNMHTLIANEI